MYLMASFDNTSFMKAHSSKLKIGLFDSGIGGLTVLKECIAQIPHAEYLYFGDTARVPYGSRSPETIQKFTWQCVEKLISEGAEIIVIACNTASAHALEYIKQKLLSENISVSVIGVLNPSATFAALSAKNKVGILATKATVKSKQYETIIKKTNPQLEVFSIDAPLLVPLIEANKCDHPATEILLKEYLDSIPKNIDTLILGCTHYPRIKKLLKKLLGHSIKIIDSAHPTALALKKELLTKGLIQNSTYNDSNIIEGFVNNINFYLSDGNSNFIEQAQWFLGVNIQLDKINIVNIG